VDGGCEKCGQAHLRCKAHNKAGKACMRWPRLGAPVCPRHGGHAPQVLAAAERRRAKDLVELRGYASAVATDPASAMNDLLFRKAGEVLFLTTIVNGLDAGALKQQDTSGRFEKPAVWVEMLWRAQDDLRKICKDMFDIGFAERQARYVDHQAMLLAAGLSWFRRELGLGEDPQAEQLERTMLAALAGGAPPDQQVIEGRTA
jgi:hypothetical protein